MSFVVRFQSKDRADVHLPQGLTARPLRFGKSIYGGCETAAIEVTGDAARLWSLLAWLGRRVIIYNAHMVPVWWGLIEDASIARGALQDGLSLRDMYNRIQIAYAHEELGGTVAGRTAWAQNDVSVNRLGFIKELLETQEVDATPLAAEAKRNALLNLVGLPLATSGEQGGSNQAPVLTFNCIGEFRTFAWRYYAQPAGLQETVLPEVKSQPLGLGLTADNICFALGGKISDLGGRFNAMPNDVKVAISGTSNNNGVRTVTQTDSREQKFYTSTTISFDPSDDIHDFPLQGLGFCEVDDFISVQGSANDAVYRINSAAGDHLTVRPANIGTDAAGPSITIQRGNYFQVSEPVVTEFPDGGNRTIAVYGQRLAQPIRITTAEAWAIDRIEITVSKVGNPGDGLALDLLADNGATPGPVILSSSLLASLFGSNEATWSFAYNLGFTPTPNTLYWLQLRRTGALDMQNYYNVEIGEDESLTSGILRLWTGTAWAVSAPLASMNFCIKGAWETTYQIRRIVEQAGQYANTVDMQAASGVWTHQYRDGETLAYDELLALMETGTVSGDPLLAEVTQAGQVRIFTPPPVDPISAIQQRADGAYRDQYGRPLPDGFLPVGRWVVRPDIPFQVAAHYKLTPRLVEEAEYDCTSNRIRRVRFHGDPDPAKILGF